MSKAFALVDQPGEVDLEDQGGLPQVQIGERVQEGINVAK